MSEKEGINKDENQEINRKLREYFDGRIVRKDLTKKIKEGANVPVYVLEYLLGQYCNSENEEIIEDGLNKVKRILADNYVRPDESQKILARLTDRGLYTIIDKVTVKVNLKENLQEAEFSNLGIKKVPIHPDYSKQYDRLLCGGIWCIVQLEHNFVEEDKKSSPIHIKSLKPIQMPRINLDDLKNGRKHFSTSEWMKILLYQFPNDITYNIWYDEADWKKEQ